FSSILLRRLPASPLFPYTTLFRSVGVVLEQHLPVLVAAMGPRDLAHDPAVHDDLLHARAADERAIGRLFHCHHLTAAVETVGADQNLGLAVAEPRRDRFRSVAREQGNDHGAD